MNLVRYAACGNTFVVVFDEPCKESEKADLVRSIVADRDGVIFVEGRTNPFFMDYFNRDGSRGEMCGNGARAFIKALYDRGSCQIEQPVIFDTFSGTLQGRMITEDVAEVSMPQPVFLSEFSHQGWKGVFYRVGVPHLVFFMPTTQGVDVEGLGHYYSHLSGNNAEGYPFPASTNVNVFSEEGEGLCVRTYERGVWRETASCGTGVTACAAVYRRTAAKVLKTVHVRTKGGRLSVRWRNRNANEEFESVYLQGSIEHYP